MQLSVSGKQMDVGDALRSHVEQHLSDSVSKYFDHAIDASVVFSRDAGRVRADISVHVGRGILVQGHAQMDSAYGAFDGACERIAKRLRRYKRRLRDHHRKVRAGDDAEMAEARHYTLAAPVDDSEEIDAETDHPVVIAESTTDIVRLTVGEAAMRMDLADQPAVVFRNAAHGRINVLYRRADGNLGWIDPEFTGIE